VSQTGLAAAETASAAFGPPEAITMPVDVLAAAATLDEAHRAALLALCATRSDLLAHAVRAVEPRGSLRPLGVLCGEEAMAYATLGSALSRLDPPGTGLTRAAVRERRPVWVASIAEPASFVRRDLLARHGIRSGAAFPIIVESKMAAVLELLCFGSLEPDPTVEVAAAAVMTGLQAVTQRLWEH
jgi:hypothetical protein